MQGHGTAMKMGWSAGTDRKRKRPVAIRLCRSSGWSTSIPGAEKAEDILFKREKWRDVIVEKRILASANSIVALADMGVAVNSENARALVQYLGDMENINYDRIPERKSVGRLGAYRGEGFPRMWTASYSTVTPISGPYSGVYPIMGCSRNGWKSPKNAENEYDGPDHAGGLFCQRIGWAVRRAPFFVHLWGVDSGTGKTVGLMLAASVWGDPQIGRYIQTFNSTAVGLEKTAAFQFAPGAGG